MVCALKILSLQITVLFMQRINGLSIIMSLLLVPCWSKAAVVQHTVYVSFDKLTYVQFASSIQSYKLGSNEVLCQVQQDSMHLQAAVERFQETNILVTTATGVYCLTLAYKAHPTPLELVYHFKADYQAPSKQDTTNNTNNTTTSWLQKQCVALDTYPRKLSTIGMRLGKVVATLHNIFSNGKQLFFKIHIHNKSTIPYEISDIRCTLQGKRHQGVLKATVKQPCYTYPAAHWCIKAKKEQVYFLIFDRFTLYPKEYLHIAVREQNGGRHLALMVHPKHFNDAEAFE